MKAFLTTRRIIVISDAISSSGEDREPGCDLACRNVDGCHAMVDMIVERDKENGIVPAEGMHAIAGGLRIADLDKGANGNAGDILKLHRFSFNIYGKDSI